MFSNIQNQKRSHESPMDWEWQTQGGPTDPTSPFVQGQKREFKLQRATSESDKLTQILGGFESSQPSSSFVAASSTPAPAFRNPSFTTPRKPFDQDLFSEVSGAESSPANNADAEDTPDLPKSSKVMTAFTSGASEKKPIFGRYGAGFLGSSPGRADTRRGKYGNPIVHKFRKRQRIERDYALTKGHRGGSDTESDSEESRPRSKGQYSKEAETLSWFSSLLNGIESRPNLPNILSYYAQLSVNFFLAGITIYGIWAFWTTIRSDVDKASEDAVAEVMAEIAKCAKDYVDNKCGKDVRLPALETVCHAWEMCMNKDPNSVKRARVSAHTFAEIFNSFIEPISYKAMVRLFLSCTKFQNYH
jgi:hypothetical protein